MNNRELSRKVNMYVLCSKRKKKSHPVTVSERIPSLHITIFFDIEVRRLQVGVIACQ